MIYLDIETLDFFGDAHIKDLPREEQLKALRFGCAVTAQVLPTGEMLWREWGVGHAHQLYRDLLWSPFDTQIVGWNIAGFDIPVIRANLRPDSFEDSFEIPDDRIIDLFAQIRATTGRWYKLEDVAMATLGRGKLADGQQATEWLRSGDPVLTRKALDYCRHDVQLVMDLHGRLLSGEYLRLPPRTKRGERNEIHWRTNHQELIPDEGGAVWPR